VVERLPRGRDGGQGIVAGRFGNDGDEAAVGGAADLAAATGHRLTPLPADEQLFHETLPVA
jgi:hypothetical protein